MIPKTPKSGNILIKCLIKILITVVLIYSKKKSYLQSKAYIQTQENTVNVLHVMELYVDDF